MYDAEGGKGTWYPKTFKCIKLTLSDCQVITNDSKWEMDDDNEI